MPSPEVINLTLSDDEIQPDPIQSDQGTSTPTRATNRFRTSSSTPPTSGINRTRRILPVIQGTFAAIERAENYLPVQPFFNNTHFGQTLINCIHNQHRIGIPDDSRVRLLPSPLATETSLKAYFPHLSLKLETF